MTLILFNKPYDVLCQFTDEGSGRPTLADFIRCRGLSGGAARSRQRGAAAAHRRRQAAGADRRSQFKLPKSYLVQVEGDVAEAALASLRQGVRLKDGMTRPAEAERIAPPALWPRDPPVRFRKTVPDCWIRLTIREGRNRQVRRMTAAIGHPTLRLVRWSIGDWTLDGVAPGEWREA